MHDELFIILYLCTEIYFINYELCIMHFKLS